MVRLIFGLFVLLASACSSGETPASPDGDVGSASDAPALQDDALLEPGQAPDADVPVAPEVETTDTEPVAARVDVFRFSSAEPVVFGTSPFPSSLYRDTAGAIRLEGLSPTHLELSDVHSGVVDALVTSASTRLGFGSTSPVYFYVDGAVDPQSLEGRVWFQELEGPGAPRRVAADAYWDETHKTIVVMPAYGEFLYPDATYGVVLLDGIRVNTGESVAIVADFSALLERSDLNGPRFEPFSALKAWIDAPSSGLALDEVLVGTAFRTQPVIDFLRQATSAAMSAPLTDPSPIALWTSYELTPIEANVISGDALESYFGTPQGSFVNIPSSWSDAHRWHSKQVTGSAVPYQGGTMHKGIGAVINGSFLAPAPTYRIVDGAVNFGPVELDDSGQVLAPISTAVPFSLFLCESDLNVKTRRPIAIYIHPAERSRGDAIPTAVGNCRVGISTIAMDLTYHGARTKMSVLPGQSVVVPTRHDRRNEYTALDQDEEGYVPDYLGDRANAAQTIGVMIETLVDGDADAFESMSLSSVIELRYLIRMLRYADWAELWTGLEFDPSRIYTVASNLGADLAIMLHTEDHLIRGSVIRSPNGRLVSSGLSMAPRGINLLLAPLRQHLEVDFVQEKVETMAFAYPLLGLFQWLVERSDAMPYAPLVYRYRHGFKAPSILALDISWDEIGHGPTQRSMWAALGIPMYRAQAPFDGSTVQPGDERLNWLDFDGTPIANNIEVTGIAHTAAGFNYNDSCSIGTESAICVQGWATPYPPITPRMPERVHYSPICQWHDQMGAFFQSLTAPNSIGEIGAPGGDCETVYGPSGRDDAGP